MPSGWYSCNSYAISKDNTLQGFVLFVQFVFSKIKRQIYRTAIFQNIKCGDKAVKAFSLRNLMML